MSYRRKLEEKKRLKRLYNKTHGGSLRRIRFCGACYSESKKRLIRFYKSDSNYYKLAKKVYHKKIRHAEIPSSKVYDPICATW